MAEPQEHVDARGNAPLSAQYAHLYVETMDNVFESASGTWYGSLQFGPEIKGQPCDNCGEGTAVLSTETRIPLCKVCFATLQQSIKVATRQGFHFGL